MTASIRLIEKEIKRLEKRYNLLKEKFFYNHFEDVINVSSQIKAMPKVDAKSMNGQAMIDWADKMEGLTKQKRSHLKKAKYQQKHTVKWETEMDQINKDLYELRATKFREEMRKPVDLGW